MVGQGLPPPSPSSSGRFPFREGPLWMNTQLLKASVLSSVESVSTSCLVPWTMERLTGSGCVKQGHHCS